MALRPLVSHAATPVHLASAGPSSTGAEADLAPEPSAFFHSAPPAVVAWACAVVQNDAMRLDMCDLRVLHAVHMHAGSGSVADRNWLRVAAWMLPGCSCCEW